MAVRMLLRLQVQRFRSAPFAGGSAVVTRTRCGHADRFAAWIRKSLRCWTCTSKSACVPLRAQRHQQHLDQASALVGVVTTSSTTPSQSSSIPFPWNFNAAAAQHALGGVATDRERRLVVDADRRAALEHRGRRLAGGAEDVEGPLKKAPLRPANRQLRHVIAVQVARGDVPAAGEGRRPTGGEKVTAGRDGCVKI